MSSLRTIANIPVQSGYPMTIRKKTRLLRAIVVNKFRPSVPFLRIIPTDYCNLSCSYCWQHSSDTHGMSNEVFVACLENALKLDVGMVSFLGGEPTLWPHLSSAIRLCTGHDLPTDITTNGSRLDENTLGQFMEAGLDLLNISVDGLTPTGSSRKCALSQPGLLKLLSSIARSGVMRVRMNAVICKSNWPFIQELLELSRNAGIPISIGYVMPASRNEFDGAIHFGPDDIGLVNQINGHIQEARRSGTRIIDPMEYFSGYERFLRRERFWLCNYATRRGWINVDPYGHVRDCTKKMARLNYQFSKLARDEIVPLRRALADGVETCNRDCYSNCAFDGAYFAKHKIQLLKSGIV